MKEGNDRFFKILLIRRLMFSAGISILIGLSIGYYFQKTNYYHRAVYNISQTEISYEEYKEKRGSDKKYVYSENRFNHEFALTSGLGVFGFLLVINSFLKKNYSN
ncbi:hypothetical protein [Marivirga sp.]|uniref:hypothetical protein n=1 Tax=Marivirga sp. TaxID=2018662 RepID=UPI003DA75BB2